MITKKIILEVAQKNGMIRTGDFVDVYNVSRQHVSRLISQLVDENKLVKLGRTRGAVYATPQYFERHANEFSTSYVKQLTNDHLEEHKVLNDIERSFALYKTLSENVKSIFAFAFSEMLNNAIEHSKSKKIHLSVDLRGDELRFVIDDFGIGVFRNIRKKRGLKNELEAIQDLLKGKTTTMPQMHSGEGIFFTSKAGDEFVLDSYGYQLIVDNKIDDVFVKKATGQKQGTKVTFKIDIKSTKHLNDVFMAYTHLTEKSDYGFDKTEVRVKLYLEGGVHVSRSQARRILSGLEKFRIIVMDYDKVPMIGQAFADEIYRVFQKSHPDIEIQNENMNEAVDFMVRRAKPEAER